MAITWQATSEFELLEEYQKHLVEIQNKFMQKISQAQAKGDTATLQKLTQDMQKTVQELAITYQEKAKTLANQDESASLYNQKLCKLDLDLTVYDGDRDYFKEFNLEPNIQKAYQEIKSVAGKQAYKNNADGSTFHKDIVDGVEWEVVNNNSGEIVASYPTGQTPK